MLKYFLKVYYTVYILKKDQCFIIYSFIIHQNIVHCRLKQCNNVIVIVKKTC